MANALPQGWVETTLNEIAKPSRRRALPEDTPNLRYIGLEHIQPHMMNLLSYGYAREVRSPSVRFFKGDVLYGKMRPYLNKVWLAEFEGVCSAEFLVFSEHKDLDNRFLAFRLNAPDFVAFANSQVSGDRPRVDFDSLARFPILLPPIREQGRIAAKLRRTLSYLTRAETAGHRVQKRLGQYLATVLEAAAAGKLTRSWRYARRTRADFDEAGSNLLRQIFSMRQASWEQAELERLRAAGQQFLDDRWKLRYREPARPQPNNLWALPSSWAWTTVDALTPGDRSCAYGVLQPGPEVADGVPLVRVGDIRDGNVTVGGLKRISPRVTAAYERTKLRGGELLITLVGAVGRTAIVPLSLEGANVARAVAVVPLTSLVHPNWVELWFRSPTKMNEMIGKAHEVARKTLNLEDVRAAGVALPPLDEQEKIVKVVATHFAAAERLSKTLEHQLARAWTTRQLLLRDAFAGRLVPQRATEEPAIVLLKRIRAAREIDARKPKVKPMPRPKTHKAAAPRRSLLAILQRGVRMTPEQLFKAAGHTQESVDEFFAELRELTGSPPKVEEVRRPDGQIFLKSTP